ncbi:hypothetical protein PDJAM_G00047420 [Pangasius djambal]|uniref:Uncharacterized protein n=1 Tax=Pangasius djambal TaxID=1691987 RepID=A0ACC5YUR5_9TELE|nr:hypothetical protein [Pangasius djambal]
MGKFDERALLLLAVCVLAAHTPAEAWYKQAAGPTYYSVGRASGLLAGIRRSAIRREEADTGDSGEATENHAVLLTNSRNFALKSMFVYFVLSEACLRPRTKLSIKRARADSVLGCVFLPARAILRAGIHTVFALSVWERSTQSRLSREPAARIASVCRCARFTPGRLSLRRESSLACLAVPAPLLPRQSGGCTRGARRWIWRREWRRASPFLLPHPPDPLSALWVRKPVSSPRGVGLALRLSSSEEVDVEGADPDLPQSPQYEELLEVVSRAVAKHSIDWPTETRVIPQGSKLDERFLRSRLPPPRQSLPFFPDLHTEVSRSWRRPFSARLFSPASSHYANVAGLNLTGYRAMPRVEQTLASYLSPGAASSLKAPALPTKPLRTTSALVGKVYMAAGQAGACLHTMAVLQAYQADLLKELDEGEMPSEHLVELRRATDLSLRATKETAGLWQSWWRRRDTTG